MAVTDRESPQMSRRSLLRAGGIGAVLAGGMAAGLGTALAPAAEAATSGSGGGSSLPFYGAHQAGVLTASQQHLTLAVLDLTIASAAELRDLLREWTQAASLLTGAQPVGSLASAPSAPPADSGEVLDEAAASLTITFGFGPSLFDERFGLSAQRPAPLADLPAFSKDQLDPQRTGGDIMVQACANSAQVADHAIRNLLRIAAARSSLRWIQRGFLDVPGAPGSTGGTPRNLLGFKDGTANLPTNDATRMANNVWASTDESPAWMIDGTYAVVRRVRTLIEPWDNASLQEQEDATGRRKYSGAPFGGTLEHDRVVSANLPIDSHVRLANPRTGQDSERERILRRGYNYADGIAPITGPLPNDNGQPVVGQMDVGLLFIAFQQDPRRQFVPMQTRLDAHDALNEYLVHTGSGIFAIAPGALNASDYIGSTLLDAPRAATSTPPPAAPNAPAPQAPAPRRAPQPAPAPAPRRPRAKKRTQRRRPAAQ